MPKLLENTHSGIRQVPSRAAQAGKGLRKQLQGMLRTIAAIQKKNRFGVGYKPDRRERQRFLEEKRQKRIASFLGKEGDSAKMDIPPLSSSFLSAGFINLDTIEGDEKEVMVDITETFGSLSIDMVEVENQETKGTRLPPFPCGQILHNWTSIELPVVFKFQNE